MNKKVFYQKLKNKEYTECIETLRKEIINILDLKIKEKDKYFKYSTTRDLYNVSKSTSISSKSSFSMYNLPNLYNASSKFITSHNLKSQNLSYFFHQSHYQIRNYKNFYFGLINQIPNF